MALLHFDGFRSYANLTDYIRTKSENVALQYISPNSSFATAYSRFGGSDRGLEVGSFSDNITWELDGSLSPSTIIFGIVFKKISTGAPIANPDLPFIRILDNCVDSNKHINICLNGSRNFEVYRDTNFLGTSSGKTVMDLVWHNLEVKIHLHSSEGTVELKLDGLQILNLAGQNTMTGSNAYARYFFVGMIYIGEAFYVDCFYLCDNTGDAPQNDFLGDVRCDVLRPNGAGVVTQFTPSAGANYENVDDTTPDDDSTKNSDDVVGHQDSYALPSLAPGGEIFGVKPAIVVAKDDAGAKSCKILTRSNGTLYKSDEVIPLTTYTRNSKIYQDNPADSLTWEEADIADMEVGVEVIS